MARIADLACQVDTLITKEPRRGSGTIMAVKKRTTKELEDTHSQSQCAEDSEGIARDVVTITNGGAGEALRICNRRSISSMDICVKFGHQMDDIRAPPHASCMLHAGTGNGKLPTQHLCNKRSCTSVVNDYRTITFEKN